MNPLIQPWKRPEHFALLRALDSLQTATRRGPEASLVLHPRPTSARIVCPCYCTYRNTMLLYIHKHVCTHRQRIESGELTKYGILP